jgi:hypothetical protein
MLISCSLVWFSFFSSRRLDIVVEPFVMQTQMQTHDQPSRSNNSISLLGLFGVIETPSAAIEAPIRPLGASGSDRETPS